MKNSDITHRASKYDYEIENLPSYTDPESLLIAMEACELAREDFEGFPMSGVDFGYRTPCTANEALRSMVRREVVGEEERLIPRDVSKVDELKWKRKVRRRLVDIDDRVVRKGRVL